MLGLWEILSYAFYKNLQESGREYFHLLNMKDYGKFWVEIFWLWLSKTFYWTEFFHMRSGELFWKKERQKNEWPFQQSVGLNSNLWSRGPGKLWAIISTVTPNDNLRAIGKNKGQEEKFSNFLP